MSGISAQSLLERIWPRSDVVGGLQKARLIKKHCVRATEAHLAILAESREVAWDAYDSVEKIKHRERYHSIQRGDHGPGNTRMKRIPIRVATNRMTLYGRVNECRIAYKLIALCFGRCVVFCFLLRRACSSTVSCLEYWSDCSAFQVTHFLFKTSHSLQLLKFI